MKRLKVAARVDVGCTAAPDPVASTQLAAVVRGLAMCVSLLHERRHELLVKELLELPLWHVPQVGSHALHHCPLPSLLLPCWRGWCSSSWVEAGWGSSPASARPAFLGDLA